MVKPAPQTIRITPDVWEALASHAEPFETPNDALRRLLGLCDPTPTAYLDGPVVEDVSDRRAEEIIQPITRPTRLWTANAVLSDSSLIPEQSGVYGVYFKSVPPQVPTVGCVLFQDFTLLYAGISSEKPKAGRAPSKQTLRDRILFHLTGNAERSTLRLSLGSLLAATIGIQLRKYGGSKTFGRAGEAKLSDWMAANLAFVWSEHEEPWSVEQTLLAQITFPLNIQHNRHQPFAVVLSRLRSAAKAAAESLPPMSSNA